MLAWFADAADDYVLQLRSFTPLMIRKNIEVDLFLRICDTANNTLKKVKNTTKPTNMLAIFKLASAIDQLNNLLTFAGRILKRSIKAVSAIVSSVEVAENISRIGQYVGNVSSFVKHPNQVTITDDLAALVDCADIAHAQALYKKYNVVALWIAILTRCGNSKMLEQSKDTALSAASLPNVMMPTWIEQMPQLFIRDATAYTTDDLAAFCLHHKIRTSVISVSNFKSADIEFVIPVSPVPVAVGISEEYVAATNTVRHITSGGIVGGIAHTRTPGAPAIIETNGVSSRFIEASENILRGTPSTRIHNYNAAIESVILKKLRPHIAISVTKVDYNTMIDSVINLLLSYYNADDVETRLYAIIPNMSDPEIRITAIRSIAPIISEIKQHVGRLTPESIRDMVICKTGIVENVLRKAYLLS
jgi:hypothetical protein